MPPSLLQSISETETSQGILAVLDYSQLPIPKSQNFILIPDQIRDPGNLGTLIRTAAAAGVQAVLLPPETTDAFAPKVVRAGMGAHFRLPIHTMEWDEIEQVCKSAEFASLPGRYGWGILLGDGFPQTAGLDRGRRSGRGQRTGTRTGKYNREHSNAREAESLNASVAGAVLMFEVVRQRN